MNSRRRIRHASEPLYGQQPTVAWGPLERLHLAGGPTSCDLFCSAGGGFWPISVQVQAAGCPQLAKADAGSLAGPPQS
jgi:hypothetical protein